MEELLTKGIRKNHIWRRFHENIRVYTLQRKQLWKLKGISLVDSNIRIKYNKQDKHRVELTAEICHTMER